MRLGDRESADISRTLTGIIDELLRRGGPDIYKRSVTAFEHLMVKKALELTKNNQVLAAKLLGISRNTLREKLDEKHNIELPSK